MNELNAIVHPAVIAAQKQWMEEVFGQDPTAIAVVESALIFEVERDARARGENGKRPGRLAAAHRSHCRGHRARRAEDRPLCRTRQHDGSCRQAADADARLRLAHQIPDAEKAARADYVLENTGDRDASAPR